MNGRQPIRSHASAELVSDLVLRTPRRWFDEMRAGTKTEEHVAVSPYWLGRLTGQRFERLVIELAYPKQHDSVRRLVFPYRGYVVKTVQRAHGKQSVFAFALQQ